MKKREVITLPARIALPVDTIPACANDRAFAVGQLKSPVAYKGVPYARLALRSVKKWELKKS